MKTIRGRFARWGRLRKAVSFLARYRGSRAIAHLIRRLLRTDDVVTIEDFDGDMRFKCHLDEHIGGQIYWFGAYSLGQLRILDRILEDGMTFLDVGANQGEFTLFAAKRLPNGVVHAFEPMAEMRERLQANVAANGFENILVHDVALADADETRPLYAGDGAYIDGCRNEGVATLYPAGDEQVPLERVECRRLDSIAVSLGIVRVDVVKLDIEGGEIAAIGGAHHILERDRPLLMVELSPSQLRAAGHAPQELVAILEKLYELFLVTRSGEAKPFEPKWLSHFGNILGIPR